MRIGNSLKTKKRSATYMMDNVDGLDHTDDKSDEKEQDRIAFIKNGTCFLGICGQEAACKPHPNNTYECVCPQDSKPPYADSTCPRITVPITPIRITDIKLPKNGPNSSDNNINDTMLPVLNKIESAKAGSTATTTTTMAGSSLGLGHTILAASIVGVVFLLIVIVIVKRKSCTNANKNSLTPSPVALKRNLLVAERYAPNPQYSSCPSSSVPLLQRDSLSFLNSIGEGFFGKVFKGELQVENRDETQIVAIKVLKDSATREAEEDFLREVDIMSTFKHPNILSLLGVVPRESNLGPMMVFEYMPHGDLAEVLRSQKKSLLDTDENLPTLGTKDLLSIALQIASGMKYLAAQRFVHRDLACRNCLLASGPIVKISDFGMSRDVYTCDYYRVGTKHILPVRWMSPECVMYGRFTLESDIWSYGVVLWEIYSFGKQPYYGHTNDQVLKLIYDGIILSPPEDCPPLICELMKNCWKTEPKDRIKFTEICEKIERAHDDYDRTGDGSNVAIVNERNRGETPSMKRLPRPPPKLPQLDLLDHEGYLLPNEIKEPVQYLVTLSG